MENIKALSACRCHVRELCEDHKLTRVRTLVAMNSVPLQPVTSCSSVLLGILLTPVVGWLCIFFPLQVVHPCTKDKRDTSDQTSTLAELHSLSGQISTNWSSNTLRYWIVDRKTSSWILRCLEAFSTNKTVACSTAIIIAGAGLKRQKQIFFYVLPGTSTGWNVFHKWSLLSSVFWRDSEVTDRSISTLIQLGNAETALKIVLI